MPPKKQRKTNRQYAAMAVMGKVAAGGDYYGLDEEVKNDKDSDEDENVKDHLAQLNIDFDIFPDYTIANIDKRKKIKR